MCSLFRIRPLKGNGHVSPPESPDLCALPHTKPPSRMSRPDSSGRRSNDSALRASERMLGEMQSHREATLARRERQAAQDDALAQEMERRRREEDARRLEMQRICEADPELRALQEKLKVRVEDGGSHLAALVAVGAGWSGGVAHVDAEETKKMPMGAVFQLQPLAGRCA
jgi:hypothetical protein